MRRGTYSEKRHAHSKLLLLALILLFSFNQALAADKERNGAMLELGASLGTPAVGNLVLGLWGPAGFPLLLRGSGMYFSKRTNGAQAELGLVTNRSEDVAAFAALVAITSTVGNKSWRGIGGGFGIIFHRLSLDLNLTAGRGDYKSPQFGFQIGFSFL